MATSILARLPRRWYLIFRADSETEGWRQDGLAIWRLAVTCQQLAVDMLQLGPNGANETECGKRTA
jgi:hypothetical protein